MSITKILFIVVVFSLIISGNLFTYFENKKEKHQDFKDSICLSGNSKVPQTTFIERGGIIKAIILK